MKKEPRSFNGFKDLTNIRIGKLTALKEVKSRDKNKKLYWLFRCDCGNEKIMRGSNVVHGTIKSCGCLRPKANPIFRSKIYRTWHSMIHRCSSPINTRYDSYGGRGIKVCDRWKIFENFKEDMLPSMDKHLRDHTSRDTSIDRIDVDDNYCKENCRWATIKEQNRNRRPRHIYCQV